MTNLHQQLVEEFENKFPVVQETSQDIAFFAKNLKPEITGWLTQAFQRISAQSEREVVERVRKDIENLRRKHIEHVDHVQYSYGRSDALDDVLASLDTLEDKKV